MSRLEESKQVLADIRSNRSGTFWKPKSNFYTLARSCSRLSRDQSSSLSLLLNEGEQQQLRDALISERKYDAHEEVVELFEDSELIKVFGLALWVIFLPFLTYEHGGKAIFWLSTVGAAVAHYYFYKFLRARANGRVTRVLREVHRQYRAALSALPH